VYLLNQQQCELACCKTYWCRISAVGWIVVVDCRQCILQLKVVWFQLQLSLSSH